MNTLQKAMEAALVRPAYELAADLISDKLEAKGIVLTGRQREKLLDQISKGSDSIAFRTWPWWTMPRVTLEITEDEAQAIVTQSSEILETRLPGLILRVADDLSPKILAALHAGWKGEQRSDARCRRGFEKRLNERWGKPIGLLRMYLIIAREAGQSHLSGLEEDYAVDDECLLDVLARLHARACQVTDEIICLLEHGFADGAMARWRTLYEIAAVALLLAKQGEEVARRYVDHHHVSDYEAAKCYRRYSERLGDEPMTDAEFEEIRLACEEVVARYPEGFENPCGWAVGAAPGGKNPRRIHIEIAAGIDHLRPYYKLACDNVHADPRGAFLRLGLMDESDILLAGASNAGLADPGQNTAISLAQVTVALTTQRPSLDSIVALQVLTRLLDEVCETFDVANEVLLEDVEKMQP